MTKVCESCGNYYEDAFVVEMDGHRHVFDSFECAINKLAPLCSHCDTKIIGHGVEKDGQFYCCEHCATHTHLPRDKKDITTTVEQNVGAEQH